MRITVRLVLALVVSAAAVSGLSTFVQMRQERRRLVEDLDRRAAILAETLQEAVEPALSRQDHKQLSRLVSKFGNRERLAGFAVLDPSGALLAGTPGIEAALPAVRAPAAEAAAVAAPVSRVTRVDGAARHLYLLPFTLPQGREAVLLLAHDASFIENRMRLLGEHNFWRLLLHALIIALVSLYIIRWNIAAPLDALAQWMHKLRAGEDAEPPRLPGGLFEPVASEAAGLGKSLAAARAAAEEEARLRQQAEEVWTPERLKEHVRAHLEGRPLFVVANREPYLHQRRGKKIEVISPASGLVTGVEPILLACGGTWIAHGSGDADRESSDEHGKLGVPPDSPKYTLKRVWLSKEEEQGYYYGLANEGLWPLCHIAHTRPIFEADDWRHYQAVNRKFADALLSELDGVSEPCVLVQDYHFALLPRMIKEARPDARVALFWHIPWPNPEAFGICPWQKELLEGMLGADILGFHIQFHCNNFLETVDRTLESRLDWERFAVNREGHTTLVRPYPISVAFPGAPAESPAPSKEHLLKELGVKAQLLGVGVDRVDYTKGIIERFRAIERLLEKYPEYQGKLAFVELGAPSRTHIKRYHDLQTEVEAEAERINWRFKGKDYKPIVLLRRHHSHAEIAPYYRSADFCLVTSLHDGMNLVAKEFVAARDDGDGVLVLSRFTGAARELRDSLIVNPYDVEQTAEAMRIGLEMEESERRRRMAGMRKSLRENNVYRWGARMIEDLAKVPRAQSAETRLA